MFRLDRVLAASLEVDTFERPADFDSLAYVHHSLATTPWGWEVEVLLDTTLEQAQQHILPWLALLAPSPEGVVLRAYVDDLDWLARQLVGLPYPCVVRRPEELKQAFREVASRAMTIAAREVV
jgi:predicted DNA-binding transcriptional regulator YafY